MKKYFILLLLSSFILCSQDNETLKELAITDAKAVAQASITKNYDAIIKYTHPNILEQYGEKTLRNGIKEVFDTMEAQNITIVRSEIEGVADIKKENKEYHCLVNNKIQMDFNGRFITIKSSLFGFYDKKKKQWFFVESNKLLNDAATQALFKNFKTEINIPEDQQYTQN